MRMTKKEFMEHYITPNLKSDVGENNLMFACTKDILHRDGMITDSQGEKWIQPKTKAFGRA